MKNSVYYFYYYIPKSHLEITKKAIFAAGAGRIGKYSCCAWETKGTGQFRPELGSKAYIGKVNKISKVREYRVEVICERAKIQKVIKALKNAHPYECPAFGVLRLEKF